MSNLATLCHNETNGEWTAVFNDKVYARSMDRQYVIDCILTWGRSKVLRDNIVGFTNVDPSEASKAKKSVGKPATTQNVFVKPNNELTVAERYELLDEMVDLVVRKGSDIRSLIITGEGSLGKTFHTKAKLKEHNLLSTQEAAKLAVTLTPEEQEVADKILQRMQECKKQAEEYYRENGLPKEDKDEIDELLDDEEADEFELVFGHVDFTTLHNSTDIKDRACGGQFLCATNGYRFNIKLAVQNPDEYYNQIVPHEVAHHVQWLLFPKSMKKLQGHGKEWKQIMRDVFKIPADRYHQMDTTDVRLAPDLAGDYHYVKGYSSAKGLFRTLYENKGKLIVFDDCDAAWKNEVSANLLKAALDSDDERWVSWNVEGSANDDLPRTFLFEGRIVFISNVNSEDFPQPLITRALRCDVEMTIDERFERMLQILPSPEFAPGISMEIKQMAYDFLYEHRERAAEISSRSLLNVIKVANTGSKLWKRIALSNIA